MIQYREMDKTDLWKYVLYGKMEIPLLLETMNSRNGLFIAIIWGKKKEQLYSKIITQIGLSGKTYTSKLKIPREVPGH